MVNTPIKRYGFAPNLLSVIRNLFTLALLLELKVVRVEDLNPRLAAPEPKSAHHQFRHTRNGNILFRYRLYQKDYQVFEAKTHFFKLFSSLIFHWL